MNRIGYAVLDESGIRRRGEVMPLGAPGSWNGGHVLSPSLVSLGGYLLMAYEGRGVEAPGGIGLAYLPEGRLDGSGAMVQPDADL